MIDFLISCSKTLGDVATTPWVWIVSGFVVWILSIWVFVNDARPRDREGAAIIGSMAGLVLGFLSPFFVLALPFLLIAATVVAFVAVCGLGVGSLVEKITRARG